jgi:hypothetical protein
MQRSNLSRTLWNLALLVLTVGPFHLLTQAAKAQSTLPPNLQNSQRPGMGGPSITRGNPSSNPMSPMDSSMPPELSRQAAIYREAARKLERKKRMVDTANRLLELTQQLHAQVERGVSTPEDAKRLDDIAKLARSVKDQMRD